MNSTLGSVAPLAMFFNWASPENASRLASPKFAWTFLCQDNHPQLFVLARQKNIIAITIIDCYKGFPCVMFCRQLDRLLSNGKHHSFLCIV